MKKLRLPLLLLLLASLSGHSQSTYPGSRIFTDLLNNPADRENDSIRYLNLFSVYAQASGNHASLGIADWFQLNQQGIRENIVGIKNNATGFGNLAFTGPSLSLPLSTNTILTLSTRQRVWGNYSDVDGRLLAEIAEAQHINQSYPFSISSGQSMNMELAAWSELGISLTQTLFRKKRHTLRGGLRLYVLTAQAHTSATVLLDGGTVNQLDQPDLPVYLRGTSGSINTLSSGTLFDSPSFDALMHGRQRLAADLGFTYTYRVNPASQRRIKMGLSLTDIGKLSYRPDTLYSKAYDVTLEDNSLWFNQNLDDAAINQITEILDRENLAYAFQQTAVHHNDYTVSLPTTLRLFADYQHNAHYGIRADVHLGIDRSTDGPALHKPNELFLTPQYKSRHLQIDVPLSYQENAGIHAGLFLYSHRVGIGSQNLFTALAGDAQQAQLFLQLNVPLGTPKTVLPHAAGKQPHKARRTNTPKPPRADTLQAPAPKAHRPVSAFASLGAHAGHAQTTPLWMRSLRHGSIPLDGLSSSLIAGAQLPYKTPGAHRRFDWAAGIEARLNAGNTVEGQLIEAYAKVKYGIFEIKAGRSKDHTGLVDSTLSSGAFAISGNALGIPKIELRVPHYWYVFGNSLIAMKGSFAHGWMGQQSLNTEASTFSVLNDEVPAYFHQKSLYGRLGKPHWAVKLFGGFNHQVMWGNEQDIYAYHTLSNVETYTYVLFGKAYGGSDSGGVPRSKVGNHVGSVDQGIEIRLKNMQLMAYHQFFYEAGALASLANVKDGIYGLSIKNTQKQQARPFRWNKLLLEFIYSKSQGGEIDSEPRASGAEDYYNNFLYIDGWSYHGENIGNPLFTTKKYLRSSLPTTENKYFANNRIAGFHGGMECSWGAWALKTLLSLTSNYGTYSTSEEGGRGRGSTIYYNEPPYFGRQNQISAFVGAERPLKNNYRISVALAADKGELLNDSFAAELRISKSW